MEKRFLRFPAQAEAMTRNPNKRRERVEVAIIKAMTVTHFISAKLQVCCLNFNAALKSMFASNTTDSRCRSSRTRRVITPVRRADSEAAHPA